MLNRRHLFGASAAVAAAALPVTASAQPDEWDNFIAGLAVMSPILAEAGRLARAQGFSPDECFCVQNATDVAPALLFQRKSDFHFVTFQYGKTY